VVGIKKWRQKHGGFSRLLTPEWRHWSHFEPATTFTSPWFSQKYFSFLFWSLPRCLPSLRHLLKHLFRVAQVAQMAGIILASERQGTNIQTSRNFGKTLFVKVKYCFVCSILICDRVLRSKQCEINSLLCSVVDNFSNWCIQLGCPNYEKKSSSKESGWNFRF
jgi:hypothetical protein